MTTPSTFYIFEKQIVCVQENKKRELNYHKSKSHERGQICDKSDAAFLVFACNKFHSCTTSSRFLPQVLKASGENQRIESFILLKVGNHFSFGDKYPPEW